jgi:hypothetical protein
VKRLTLLFLAACNGGDDTDKPNDPCTEIAFYADADGDGYGDPFTLESACEAPDGFVDNRDDCDDGDADERPGQTWYRDVDGDGFGDDGTALDSCHRPVGYIQDAGDCDDQDSTRFPDAMWFTDADEDGFGDANSPIDACGDVDGATSNDLDCDDEDWLIHPDANEACDGIDNDCDELVDDEDDSIDTFTQVPVFVDEDGDGYGTSESLGRACPMATAGAFVSGDCDDTDPQVYPHRLDFNDATDSDCDETTDMFMVSSSEGGWIGTDVSSAFGVFMIAKDLDGDGLNELVSSGYNYDNAEGVENVGTVKLIPGDIQGDQTTWPEEDARAWNGVESEGRLGYFGMAFAGDWDGDGIEDLVVGAPQHNENAGMAYIFSTEMEEDTVAGAHLTMEFLTTDTFWGQSAAGIGDINDDGLDDVLIGARKDSTAGTNRGSVAVVLGGSEDVGDLIIHGGSNSDQFGFNIANLGDADGDGLDDVAISAPYGDDGSNNGGDILLFSAADLLAATPVTEDTTVFYGMQVGEYAGMGLVAAGDFNGDGLDDMLIGSPYYDVSDSEEGAAYIVLGSSVGWESTALSDAHLQMLGTATDDKAGRYPAAAGDITGDDLDDIFVSVHTWDGVDDNMGIAYGVLGGHAGGIIDLAIDADLLVIGDGSNDTCCRGIAPAGDTNDDGIGDMWMGAPGAGSTGTLYLVHGASPGW